MFRTLHYDNHFSLEQEVKVQELSEDVPVGHIPRSLTLHVKGNLTRTMRSRSTQNVNENYFKMIRHP